MEDNIRKNNSVNSVNNDALKTRREKNMKVSMYADKSKQLKFLL